MTVFLVLLLAIGSHIFVKGQEQCAGVTNLPQFRDPGNTAPRIPYRNEVIIPSYQFKCCGVVTSWGAYVEPGGSNDEMVYTARFQVWRPTGNDNEYTLVGENVYSDPITLIDRSELRVDANEPRIVVQPNDVVGYYLDSIRESDNRGVQLDTDLAVEVYYRPSGTDNSIFNIDAIGVTRESIGSPILLVNVDIETQDCLTRGTGDANLAAILAPSLPISFILGFLTATVIFVIRTVILKRRKQEEEHAAFIRRLNESGRHSNSAVLAVLAEPVGGALQKNMEVVSPFYSELSPQENDSIALNSNNAYTINSTDKPSEEVYSDPNENI